MKKVMHYLCNLYDRWSNKRLIRLLLALLLALAVPAPVLLGGDDDHDRNNDRNHGRFVDPIVGSWIIHVTVDTFTPTPNPPPPFKFDNIAAFWEDGITTSSDPTQGTSYGVWKKMGPRTYLTKIVQVNADGTITTISAPSTLNPQGDQMIASFQGMITDSTGKTVLARFSGTVTDNRITFDSTP
jgi:hypothetical protein